MKNRDFWPISRLSSDMIQDRAIATMKCEYASFRMVLCSIILNDKWPKFQGHVIIWRCMSQQQYEIPRNTNRDLHSIHTPCSAVLFRMILSDIEWHSEILNDTNATAEFLVDSVMLTSYFYFLQHGTQFTTPCSNYGELRNIIRFDFSALHISVY